jgi:hypothetical protein
MHVVEHLRSTRALASSSPGTSKRRGPEHRAPGLPHSKEGADRGACAHCKSLTSHSMFQYSIKN